MDTLVFRRSLALLAALLLALLAAPTPAQAQSVNPAPLHSLIESDIENNVDLGGLSVCEAAAVYAHVIADPDSGYPNLPARYSQGGNLPNDPQSNGQYLARTGAYSFDCSGLTWWAWAKAGLLFDEQINIGLTTYQQQSVGVANGCTLSDMRAGQCWRVGDLVFLRYAGGQHVSIYLGNGWVSDCYNHETGCVMLKPNDNSFYNSNFWQGRRVATCEGQSWSLTGDWTTQYAGDIPLEYPRFDLMPDIAAYVFFDVPDCEHCSEDGTFLFQRRLSSVGSPSPRQQQLNLMLPTRDDWVRDFRVFGVTLPYIDPINGILRLVLVGWFLAEQLMFDLLCWLLFMLQMLATMLQALANALIAAMNFIVRFELFAWLTLRVLLYQVWLWLGSLSSWLNSLSVATTMIIQWVEGAILLLWQLVQMIGLTSVSFIDLMWAAINIALWISALVTTIQLLILAGLMGVNVPAELQNIDGHGAYYMTRGVTEGIIEHEFVSVFWLLMVALIYVGWVTWIQRKMTPRGS